MAILFILKHCIQHSIKVYILGEILKFHMKNNARCYVSHFDFSVFDLLHLYRPIFLSLQ